MSSLFIKASRAYTGVRFLKVFYKQPLIVFYLLKPSGNNKTLLVVFELFNFVPLFIYISSIY
jgi:hypothetical protein